MDRPKDPFSFLRMTSSVGGGLAAGTAGWCALTGGSSLEAGGWGKDIHIGRVQINIIVMVTCDFCVGHNRACGGHVLLWWNCNGCIFL